MAIINALTINVEDYFQAAAFQRGIKVSDWNLLSPRIEYAVNKLLLLLSDHKVTATFFVYGWTINRFPAMLKTIAEQGHELAYRESRCSDSYHLNKRIIIDDLKRYKEQLAQITSQRITGYRGDTMLARYVPDWLENELILAGYEYFSVNSRNKPQVPSQSIVSRVDSFQYLNVSTHIALTKQCEIINPYSIRFRKYESSQKLMNCHLEDTKTPVLACISTWLMDDQQPNLRADSLFKKYLHTYHIKSAPLILHQLFSEYDWKKISDIYLHKIVSLHNIKSKRGSRVS